MTLSMYHAYLASIVISPQADRWIGLAIVALLAAIPVMLVMQAWYARRQSRLTGRSPRRLLQHAAWIAGIATVASAVYALWIEPNRVTVTRVSWAYPEAPPGRTVRIAHLSDPHILHHDRVFDRVLARVAAERPDVIFVTGDLIQSRHHPQKEAFAHGFFQRLARIAPLVMILGNHDAPHTSPDSPQWHLLRNETLEMEFNDVPLRVHGWREPISGANTGWQPPALGIDDMRVNIVLTHSPDWFSHAAAQGADLALAGHTHGGQVRLPWWGAVIVPCVTGKQFEYGRYRVGAMDAFVTRGIGENPWPAPPIRFLCPPEVVIITLRHAVLPGSR